jgi:hypothetical protein
MGSQSCARIDIETHAACAGETLLGPMHHDFYHTRSFPAMNSLDTTQSIIAFTLEKSALRWLWCFVFRI